MLDAKHGPYRKCNLSLDEQKTQVCGLYVSSFTWYTVGIIKAILMLFNIYHADDTLVYG